MCVCAEMHEVEAVSSLDFTLRLAGESEKLCTAMIAANKNIITSHFCLSAEEGERGFKRPRWVGYKKASSMRHDEGPLCPFFRNQPKVRYLYNVKTHSFFRVSLSLCSPGFGQERTIQNFSGWGEHKSFFLKKKQKKTRKNQVKKQTKKNAGGQFFVLVRPLVVLDQKTFGVCALFPFLLFVFPLCALWL